MKINDEEPRGSAAVDATVIDKAAVSFDWFGECTCTGSSPSPAGSLAGPLGS